MPVTHRFDPDLATLFVDIEGALSDDEMVRAIERLAADPAVQESRRELVDLRRFASPGLSTDALRAMAEAFRAHEREPEHSRVAFVASTDWAFGISRMYQAYRGESPVQLRVFRDMAEARRWLGLPDD